MHASPYQRTPLVQQLTKNAAMAPAFVLAVTTDGKVCRFRQCSQQVQHLAGIATSHLRAKFLRERGPIAIARNRLCFFDQLRVRRQIGQPHVVIVAGGEFAPGHAARRSPNGTDTQPFVGRSRRPKLDDADAHVFFLIRGGLATVPRRIDQRRSSVVLQCRLSVSSPSWPRFPWRRSALRSPRSGPSPRRSRPPHVPRLLSFRRRRDRILRRHHPAVPACLEAWTPVLACPTPCPVASAFLCSV